MGNQAATPSKVPSSRLLAVDVLRGLAVVAMIIFHAAWDMSSFGFLPSRMMFEPGWFWFGNIILFSFLAISGFSMSWGWRKRFDSRSVMIRFFKIAAGAAAITISTYLVVPDTFVYFGVLHHIALGSLILVLLRRVPSIIVIFPAVLLAVLPFLVRLNSFNAPWLCWIGLSEVVPPSNDFVPLLPWFPIMLAGSVLGRWAPEEGTRKFTTLGSFANWFSPFAWVGRHSFLIYLLHQPVIWGGLYLWSRLQPVTEAAPL